MHTISFLHSEKVNAILTEVIKWASNRLDISAVALVGSWARGTARADSDIDLMFLTPNPSSFQNSLVWIDEINWESIGCEIEKWKDEEYGLVWSRHIYFKDEIEIEFSFGLTSWAFTEPIDRGTFRVVSDGFCILYDPKNLMNKLLDKVQSSLDK